MTHVVEPVAGPVDRAAADSAARSSTLRVALGEYDIGWENPARSLSDAESLVRQAADRGARLVALPELSPTAFPMTSRRLAEPLDGPSITRLRSLARDCGVWLAPGVATLERLADGEERPANSPLVIPPEGESQAHSRK